jgi:hypothetical protein
VAIARVALAALEAEEIRLKLEVLHRQVLVDYANEIRRERNDSLRDVRDKLCGIELNLSNYSDDDVRELQNNMIEGVAMIAAIMGKEGGE